MVDSAHGQLFNGRHKTNRKWKKSSTRIRTGFTASTNLYNLTLTPKICFSLELFLYFPPPLTIFLSKTSPLFHFPLIWRSSEIWSEAAKQVLTLHWAVYCLWSPCEKTQKPLDKQAQWFWLLEGTGQNNIELPAGSEILRATVNHRESLSRVPVMGETDNSSTFKTHKSFFFVLFQSSKPKCWPLSSSSSLNKMNIPISDCHIMMPKASSDAVSWKYLTGDGDVIKQKQHYTGGANLKDKAKPHLRVLGGLGRWDVLQRVGSITFTIPESTAWDLFFFGAGMLIQWSVL